MRTAKDRKAELNTSSVAGIAFLLLSFFLMTAVINTDKGLTITLPEWRDQPIEHPVPERNLFKIQFYFFRKTGLAIFIDLKIQYNMTNIIQ